MAHADRGRPGPGPWSGASYGLLGRDAELAAVRAHLGGGGRVATVLAEAGAGKTSLVEAVATASSGEGWAVLRAQGRLTERMLGLATLLDLVDPGLAPTAEVADLASSIRERVLGHDQDVRHDGLRLRRDVHQWLLAQAEPRTPLLVVIDDVQWVDPASWSVLSFVANRLGLSSASFLLASRADVAPPGLEDRPVVRLATLSVTDAAALIERDGPALTPTARAAVVERAAGNPLALLELARLGGTTTTSETISARSVPAAVEAAFAADLPGLPGRTQELLLLVASGGDDPVVLARAIDPSESVAELLEPAERVGLVRVAGRQVVFRHPLVQSTVYGLASARERAATHGRLAELYAHDDDRRVWHRAAASDRPDESVAVALMASADRMARRGAQQEAADAVVRAAELTLDPEVRDQRLLVGVAMSSAIGHVHQVSMLAEHFRRRSSSPLVRARAAQLHAYALAQTMQQALAQDTLQASLEELIKLDDEAGWASLTTLASLTYQTCRRREVLAHWLERYEAITPHDLETHPLNAAARAWIWTALDPLARPTELRQLVRSAPDLPAGGWPVHAPAVFDMLIGATAWLLDEHGTARERLTRAVEVMQRTGVLQPLPQTVMALGQVQFDMGQYDEADRSGRLMLDIGEAQGLPYYRAVGRELRARVAAVRGDHQAAIDEIDRLLADTEPGQSAALEANLHVDRALALAGLRDYEGAFRQLRRLFSADGEPAHPHVSLRSLADLVSAAVRVGRGEEVVASVEAAERLLDDLPGQRMTRVLSRAKALIADDASAGALFDRAVGEPGADLWPLEWAHAHLEYGLWLRRRHRLGDARHHLRTAYETYVRLGAMSLAAAAEAELRAAGVRVGSDRDEHRWADLTAQEREIVLLAASGLSNKEIAQTLFLSPRTVGAHLYHAFPKLGVTARTQLRDLVDQLRQG